MTPANSSAEERAKSNSESARGVMRKIQDALLEIDAAAHLVAGFSESNKGHSELFGHLDSLVDCLKEIEKENSKGALASLRVPVDFLDHLDREKRCNPELYTAHKLDIAREELERKKRVTTDLRAMQDKIQEELNNDDEDTK